MNKDKFGLPLNVGDTVLYPKTPYQLLGTIIGFTTTIVVTNCMTYINTEDNCTIIRPTHQVTNYNAVQEMVKVCYPELLV
jgi:hypothetical protein